MGIKKILRIVCFVTVGVMGVCMVGCGKEKEKSLVMGCSAEYPPFEFRKNGELIGFDVDLAMYLCKRLGYHLEVKDMNFDSLIAGLNSGRVDFVMSGMTVTEERVKRVDFSQMYYEPKFAIIFRKDAVVDAIEKMKGKRVGVQLGTTMESFLKEETRKLEDVEISALDREKDINTVEILALNKNPELIQELKIGRIEAVVIEESQAEEFVKANSDLGYAVLKDSAGEGYAIAFKKGSLLKSKFDEVLEEIKASGELKAILKKWGLD